MSHLLNVKDGVVFSEEVDYTLYRSDRPTYRLLNVAPTSGNSITVNSATNDTYFEVTPNVFNFSKSYLEYKLDVGAAGAGTFNCVYRNKPNIQSINIYTKSGIHFVQLDYVNKFIWAIGRKNMKIADYICRPSNSTCSPLHGNGFGYADAKDASAGGQFNGEALPVTVDAKAGLFPATEANGKAGGAILLTANALPKSYRPDGSELEDVYLESKYVEVSSANTALSLNIRFPLSDVCETLLSMDKDLYFKENVIMKITWEPKTTVGYIATAVSPPAGVGVFVDGKVAISNVNLRMAIQTNRKLIGSTMELINSGLSLDIPFVTVLRNPAGTVLASQPLNTNVKINNGMGKSLIKIIHTIYHADETKNTAFDNSNRSADGTTTSKLGSYYTQINSQRLQDYNLACSLVNNPSDDYQWNSFYTNNSAIFNNNVYVANWFHEDNFSNINNNSGLKESQIAFPGIPLDTEINWYFYGTSSPALPAAPDAIGLMHHTFVVTRKTLNISPMGVALQ